VERLKLSLTQAEFDDLKTLMRMKRWDWPAVFSTNNRREIWPFVTNGYTPEENRKQVRGESRVIDALRETYNRKAIPMCSWQSIKDIFCVFPDFLNQVWEAISRSK